MRFVSVAHQKLIPMISHFITPFEHMALAEYFPKIRRCFSMGTIEGIVEALTMEADDWSDQLLQDLFSRSPTSIAVIFSVLNRAINSSFDEVIAQDLIVAKHFLQGHDLFEGVRALLIDKDNKPSWNPAELSSYLLLR